MECNAKRIMRHKTSNFDYSGARSACVQTVDRLAKRSYGYGIMQLHEINFRRLSDGKEGRRKGNGRR